MYLCRHWPGRACRDSDSDSEREREIIRLGSSDSEHISLTSSLSLERVMHEGTGTFNSPSSSNEHSQLTCTAGNVALTSVRCLLAEGDTALLNGTAAIRDRGESPSGT